MCEHSTIFWISSFEQKSTRIRLIGCLSWKDRLTDYRCFVSRWGVFDSLRGFLHWCRRVRRGVCLTGGISRHRWSEDYTSVFLSENETCDFYSERYGEDRHALSQILRRKTLPVNFMFLLGFPNPNSFISFFFYGKNSTAVHRSETSILQFPRHFRERNQSFSAHRWYLFSAQHNPSHRKSSS